MIWKVWRNENTGEDRKIARFEDAMTPPDLSGAWKQVRAPRYVPAFTDDDRMKARCRIYLVAFLLILGILLQIVAVWWDYLPVSVGHVLWTEITGLIALGLVFNL